MHVEVSVLKEIKRRRNLQEKEGSRQNSKGGSAVAPQPTPGGLSTTKERVAGKTPGKVCWYMYNERYTISIQQFTISILGFWGGKALWYTIVYR